MFKFLTLTMSLMRATAGEKPTESPGESTPLESELSKFDSFPNIDASYKIESKGQSLIITGDVSEYGLFIKAGNETKLAFAKKGEESTAEEPKPASNPAVSDDQKGQEAAATKPEGEQTEAKPKEDSKTVSINMLDFFESTSVKRDEDFDMQILIRNAEGKIFKHEVNGKLDKDGNLIISPKGTSGGWLFWIIVVTILVILAIVLAMVLLKRGKEDANTTQA